MNHKVLEELDGRRFWNLDMGLEGWALEQALILSSLLGLLWYLVPRRLQFSKETSPDHKSYQQFNTPFQRHHYG